jgi:hypothetical protein
VPGNPGTFLFEDAGRFIIRCCIIGSMNENMPPEEFLPPEDPVPTGTPLPEETSLPEDFIPLERTERLPRSRRRRAQRMLVPPGADERAAQLDDLSRRAFPTFEFFLFAFLCGSVLGAAYLLDSPAFLLLGLLLAPLLTPWVGLTLATLTGSWRFFFLTFGGVLVAGILVFLTGALAGLAGRLFPHLPLFHANIHSHLWWPDLLLVTLGAVLLAISFVRSEEKPLLPSIMLAYGLFLPLSAGGVGLGMGAARIWPDGLLVFLIHLALATFVGIIALAILRFKPLTAAGYLLPVLAVLGMLVFLFYRTGLASVIRDGITATRPGVTRPTTTVLSLPSPTVASVVKTPTSKPTLAPSNTAPASATPQSTPAYAVITSSAGGGALVRTEPAAGTVVATLINGSIVQVLPETQTVGTTAWVHIRLENNVDGWVLKTVMTVTTTTPSPIPSPTFTPTR